MSYCALGALHNSLLGPPSCPLNHLGFVRTVCRIQFSHARADRARYNQCIVACTQDSKGFGVRVSNPLEGLPSQADEPHPRGPICPHQTGFEGPITHLRPFSCQLKQFRHVQARSWTWIVRGCLCTCHGGILWQSELIPKATPGYDNLHAVPL